MSIKLKQLHKIILTKILILSVLNLKGSDFYTTSILKKIDLQIESTSSINKMYNFQFDDAEKELERIREIMSNTYELPPLDMIG